MEIKDMTAVQLSAAIKEGKITVADAVEASLAAVKASEESIHAFLLVDEEGARARAAEVQKKIDAGEAHRFAGRRSDCGQGQHLYKRSCDDVCVKDPAELCSDVRCRGYHTARRGGSRYHRKDKHG